MNRFVLLISTFVILFSGIVNFMQAENVTITFNESDFIFTHDDNGAVEISSYKLSPLYDNNDAPGLPYIMKDVAVPSGQVCRNVCASYSKRLIMSDVDIAPNPLTFTTDYAGPIAHGRVAVCTDSIYPTSICEYSGKSNWSSFNSLYLRTCPFIYNVRERNLYFIDSMEVTVETEEESAEPQVRKVRPNFEIEEMAYSRLVNPTAVKIPQRAEKEITLTPSERIEYVIITNEALRASFEPLAKWKKTKGVPSKIITMEEIEEQYAGDRPQMKLKNCLYDLYQNKGLKFALLGGDGNVVPIQGCQVNGGSASSDQGTVKLIISDMPTDLFYACLGDEGDLGWNQLENSLIGEINDNVSLVPSIYVSRAPVDRAYTANSFVQKVIKYEQKPVYNNTILMAGCHMSPSFPCGQNSDVELWANNLYNEVLAPNWAGKRYRFFDTCTDFEGGKNYEFISDNLEEQLRKGYNFIQILTHGSEMNWKVADATDTTYYGSMHAGHTDQGGHCIITTTACTTNAFDNYYTYATTPNVACLGSTFIKNPKGALAYLGCSRAGLFSQAESNRPLSGVSFNYEKSFYKYLFADSTIVDKNYAHIVAKAKADYIHLSNFEPSYYRWIQYGLNPLGDPEMPIFTSSPLTFNSATFQIVNDTNCIRLNVNSNVDNCRICLMSADDDGASYYNVQYNVKNATFTNPPKNCIICITKQNYIPKQFKIIFLQNEEINGINTSEITSNKIAADAIFIGNSVNNAQPTGNVTFKGVRSHLYSDDILFETGVIIEDDAQLIIGK